MAMFSKDSNIFVRKSVRLFNWQTSWGRGARFLVHSRFRTNLIRWTVWCCSSERYCQTSVICCIHLYASGLWQLSW